MSRHADVSFVANSLQPRNVVRYMEMKELRSAGDL